MKYKRKLFLYFVLVFSVFVVGLVIFTQRHEKVLKTEALEQRLDSYADVIDRYISTRTIDSIQNILPSNMRLTILDRQGDVMYDNSVENTQELENHFSRSEIKKAQNDGVGSEIRLSDTKNITYLYYAKRYPHYFVRVALPYDIQIERFVNGDNVSLYFIVFLFVIMLLFVNIVADRFAKSVDKLRQFAFGQYDCSEKELDFPNDELGDIGRQIFDNYKQIQQKQKELNAERDKLLQHSQTSGEGMCFFSSDHRVEFYNGLFVQYVNTLSDNADSTPRAVLEDNTFAEIIDFVCNHSLEKRFFQTTIDKHGKVFQVVVNVFENDGFEIIIRDITNTHKTYLLKKEMTANVAHELRTPVTSIRGYLEIALDKSTDYAVAKEFAEKAYKQTIVLSDLIRDMSLLTKLEEHPSEFHFEKILVPAIVERIKSEFSIQMEMQNVKIETDGISNVELYGNQSLIYSIFRNLTDNVIRYAGKNTVITIKLVGENDNLYDISFSDNGTGIDERHLNRIFERFYRISEGRTRQSGGSGLGLSIVKNAVQLHNGTIVAKTCKNGGLEFLITLPKYS